MPKNTLENIEDTLRDVEGRAVYNFLAAKTQTPPLGQLRAAVYNALANNVGRRGGLPEYEEALRKKSEKELRLDKLAATINGRQ